MKTTPPPVQVQFLPVGGEGGIVTVTLSRPEVRNALNRALLESLRLALTKIQAMGTRCRVVLVKGEGGHFCAGADIAWMEAAQALGEKENREESVWLLETFRWLYELPVPTLALVEGAAFGGGVGIAACCDWVLAKAGAEFCLPETRLGNLAASVLPFLVNKMKPSELRRWGLSGNRFSAEEAAQAGLVDKVVEAGDWAHAIRQEVAGVLKGEPSAQAAFKRLHQRFSVHVTGNQAPGLDELGGIFAQRRVSQAGREGFRAFLQKRSPPWALELPANWQI